MKVKMLKTMACPTGTACAGTVADLPNALAKQLIEVKAAEPYGAVLIEEDPKPEIETSTTKSIVEKAITRRRGRPRKVNK